MKNREQYAREVWAIVSRLVLDDDRRQAASEAVGVSFARVRMLRRLADGPLTQRELAERLSADAPYVTLMVDDLERTGYVERGPHPTDGRAKLVSLTREGHRAAAKAAQLLDEPPAALKELSTADLAGLVRILDRLDG